MVCHFFVPSFPFSLTILGGARFYERVEVKIIIDYLRVIKQPDSNDALARIINIPSRRIGDTTIKGLLEEADQSNSTLWSLILGAVQGRRSTKTTLSTQAEKGLREFVNIILTARKRIADPEYRYGTVKLIEFVLKETKYEAWLETHHDDVAKGRWANVEELIQQASDFQDMIETGYDDESLPQVEGIEQDSQSDPLSRFLVNVALAMDKSDEKGVPTAQVTISTIHAAKGLEWPIVFVPATYQGSIPHSRSEDTNEERRLLYVAMTRAKALLYMSYPLKNSQGEQATLSPFLSPPPLAPLLDEKGPSLNSSTIQSMAQILRRPVPSLESISKSSQLLVSNEDNLFSVRAEDEDIDGDSRRNSKGGQLSFTMGQRPAKRQRIELGCSTSNIEERSTIEWQGGYVTTMEGASKFTSATMTLKAEFGTARSHLRVLNEQSVNCAIEKEKPEVVPEVPKSKLATKHKSKFSEVQGTLHAFLGKPGPQAAQRPAPIAQDLENMDKIKSVSADFTRCINQPRRPTTSAHISIAPDLASHRLTTGQPATRPRQGIRIDEQKKNDYVFLSSSPPRAKAPTPEPEPEECLKPPPRGLTSNPSILPLIQPSTTVQVSSLHTTRMSMLQSTTMKRTLGVKRSMNGWGDRKGQAFIPPTIRRP